VWFPAADLPSAPSTSHAEAAAVTSSASCVGTSSPAALTTVGSIAPPVQPHQSPEVSTSGSWIVHPVPQSSTFTEYGTGENMNSVTLSPSDASRAQRPGATRPPVDMLKADGAEVTSDVS